MSNACISATTRSVVTSDPPSMVARRYSSLAALCMRSRGASAAVSEVAVVLLTHIG